MVLSSTYSLPPTRYSRDVLQKLADIVDQLTTVVDAFCAISKNLNTINNGPFTAIVKPPIIQTNQCDNNTPTIATPQTGTQQVITPPPLNTMKPEITSKDIVTQNTSTTINISNTINITTIITKSDIKDTTYTPPVLQTIIQHDMVTFHSTNLHQICDFSTLEDKLETKRVRFLPSLFINIGFRCVKTCHSGHNCHPPKFVFLESKHEPPWKLFTLDYGNLGLEDKAVFQDGSIDTCMTCSGNP